MFHLIHGQETFLSLDHAKKLAGELADKTGAEVSIIDAETIDPTKIVNLLTTPSMFQNSNVYIIKRIYRNKYKDSIIDAILNGPKQNSLSFLIWEDQKINKTTKYFKFFEKEVDLFEKGDKRSVTSWLKNALETRGIQFTQDTLKTLASRCNYDSERIFHTIEKLELIETKVMTEELLEEMVTDTLEIYAWDLTDAINRKDRVNALIIYEELLRQQVDPNIILAMISNNFKSIAQIHLLLKEGMQSTEIAKSLSIHPFVVAKSISSAKTITWTDIQFFFKKLTSLDLANKKGEVDIQLGTTLLLTRIN
ncbi:DNA polymerase III subunit delta [Candidatus Dojkabacteria bacterium]|nr:DNA polymerase III subunit delta [Candidatus Dojkabacteria bacterium]